MPLLVHTSELRIGMRLRNPVVVGGRVMLQGGKELSRADIDVLRRRFPDLSLRIEDSVLDDAVEFEDDDRERAVAHEVQRKVTHSMNSVRERFSERSVLRPTDVEVLERAVTELMEYLANNRTTAAVVGECLGADNPLSAHVGNVFYLSMLLASATREYIVAENQRMTSARDLSYTRAADLAALGLGSVLADIAMMPLAHVYTPGYTLSDEDRRAIREHPTVGATMLPESVSPIARAIVRQHHENFAGTGYPARIPGERIHVFARVVRIADAFTAATSDRVYHGAKSPARALWEMTVGPYKRFYDPILMQAFTRLIQPFPIGAKIRLRDGRYGAVVRYNRQNPFRPTVIVAFDTQDQPIPREQLEKPINLAERNDLRISSFRGEDLSFVYSTLADDASTPEKFISPLEASFP